MCTHTPLLQETELLEQAFLTILAKIEKEIGNQVEQEAMADMLSCLRQVGTAESLERYADRCWNTLIKLILGTGATSEDLQSEILHTFTLLWYTEGGKEHLKRHTEVLLPLVVPWVKPLQREDELDSLNMAIWLVGEMACFMVIIYRIFLFDI